MTTPVRLPKTNGRVMYEVRGYGLACSKTGCSLETFRELSAARRAAVDLAKSIGFDRVYLLRVESLPFPDSDAAQSRRAERAVYVDELRVWPHAKHR